MYVHKLCCTMGIGVCIVLCCIPGVGVCIVWCCKPWVNVRVVHCVYVHMVEYKALGVFSGVETDLVCVPK